jgi:hypothetical protein
VNSGVDVYVAGTPRVVVSVIVVVLATNIHCVQVPPGVTDEQGVVLDVVEVELPQYSVEDTFWLTKTDVMFALELSGWVELVAELFLGIEGSGINARAALDVVVALTSKAIAAAELDVFAPLDVLVIIDADSITDKLPTDADGDVLSSELPSEDMVIEVFRERLPLKVLVVSRIEVLNEELPAMDIEVTDDEVWVVELIFNTGGRMKARPGLVVEPVAVDVSPSPDKATSTKLMTDSPGVAELETLAKLEVLLVVERVGAGAIPMPMSTPPFPIDLEDVVVNEELVLVEAIGLAKTGGSKTGGNTSAGADLVD